MRIVIPTIGSIGIARAMLGPEMWVKIGFSLQYLYDMRFKSREAIGVSLQSDRTKYTSGVFSAAAFIIILIFGPAVAFEYLYILLPAAIFAGLIFGVFAGCIHSLPIKPWMYITTLKEGVQMQVRKKQRCPCIYWGGFCTDVHNYEQVLLIHTTDEIKFNTLLKGGIQQGDFG